MFKNIGISDSVIKLLANGKFKKPTEVQEHCIPLILAGNDVVACAKTGSGKTLAFLIPVIQNLLNNLQPYYCVIITPTRELAHQIGEQAKNFLADQRLAKVIVVTGGKDIKEHGTEMAAFYNILIATPGRLAHLIRDNENRDEWSLKRVKYLILDEADRLLEDNFGADLQDIFSAMGTKRKTLLFTATLTGPVMDVVKSITNNAVEKNVPPPVIWRASGMTDDTKVSTVATLKQYAILSRMKNLETIMFYIVDRFLISNSRSLIMIFTNKCKWCQMLHMMFKSLKYKTVMLHSVMTEQDREKSLATFKSSTVRIMIATDVASRGLDIPQVDLVINHNVPVKEKSYVHRVGRTARAGRSGTSITLTSDYDVENLKKIKDYIGHDLENYPLDQTDLDKISRMWTEISLARREAERKLDDIKFDDTKKVNKLKRKFMNETSRKTEKQSKKSE